MKSKPTHTFLQIKQVKFFFYIKQFLHLICNASITNDNDAVLMQQFCKRNKKYVNDVAN